MSASPIPWPRLPTLEEICEQVGVSPEALDQKCADESQKILAKYCGPWERVARQLFPADTIENLIEEIEKDNRKADDQRSEFVRRWMRELGHEAKYSIFMKALLQFQLSKKVENILKRLKKGNLLGNQFVEDLGAVEPGSQAQEDGVSLNKNPNLPIHGSSLPNNMQRISRNPTTSPMAGTHMNGTSPPPQMQMATSPTNVPPFLRTPTRSGSASPPLTRNRSLSPQNRSSPLSLTRISRSRSLSPASRIKRNQFVEDLGAVEPGSQAQEDGVSLNKNPNLSIHGSTLPYNIQRTSRNPTTPPMAGTHMNGTSPPPQMQMATSPTNVPPFLRTPTRSGSASPPLTRNRSLSPQNRSSTLSLTRTSRSRSLSPASRIKISLHATSRTSPTLLSTGRHSTSPLPSPDQSSGLFSHDSRNDTEPTTRVVKPVARHRQPENIGSIDKEPLEEAIPQNLGRSETQNTNFSYPSKCGVFDVYLVLKNSVLLLFLVVLILALFVLILLSHGAIESCGSFCPHSPIHSFLGPLIHYTKTNTAI